MPWRAEADPRRRALPLKELQALVDHAVAQVSRVHGCGRKGWLAVFRDAALMKAAYGFGLRRTEVQMLDVAELGANPHAAEFRGFGVCHVRFGKALKGQKGFALRLGSGCWSSASASLISL